MLRCKYFRENMLLFTLMFPSVIILRGEWTGISVHTDVEGSWICLLWHCGGQGEVGWLLLQVPGLEWAPGDTGIMCSQFGSMQSCGSWSLLFVLWPFLADWHWSFMHQIGDLLWLTFWDDWIWINPGKNISIFYLQTMPSFSKNACSARGHGQIKSSFDWDSVVKE